MRHRLAARHPARDPRGEQDGPRGLEPRRFRGDRRRVRRHRPVAACAPSRIPLSALRGRHGGLRRREPLLVMAGPRFSSAGAASPVDPVSRAALSVQLVSRLPRGERPIGAPISAASSPARSPSATTVVVRPRGVRAKVAEITRSTARWRRRAGRSCRSSSTGRWTWRCGDILTHRHDAPSRRPPFHRPPGLARPRRPLRPAGATGSSRARRRVPRHASTGAAPPRPRHARARRRRAPSNSTTSASRGSPSRAPSRSMPTAPTGTTGSFVLIDDATHPHGRGGMVEGSRMASPAALRAARRALECRCGAMSADLTRPDSRRPRRPAPDIPQSTRRASAPPAKPSKAFS